MFDSLVVPIILYGSEVWGIYSTPEIDQIHLRFCKLILGVKQQTPNDAVFCELGRIPLAVICKQRALHFWITIMNKQDSFMYRMFNEQRMVYNNNNVNRNFKSWYVTLLNVLNNFELEYILHNLTIIFTICHVYPNAYVTNVYISGRILCPFNQSCIIIECLKMCSVTNCT